MASFYCTWVPLAYILVMPSVPLTVVETPQFLRQAEDVWSEAERQEFVDYIARNPETGDLIPETGGVRKVRWRRQGMGKRAARGLSTFTTARQRRCSCSWSMPRPCARMWRRKRRRRWRNSRHASSAPCADEARRLR
jgi:hypothetical protein